MERGVYRGHGDSGRPRMALSRRSSFYTEVTPHPNLSPPPVPFLAPIIRLTRLHLHPFIPLYVSQETPLHPSSYNHPSPTATSLTVPDYCTLQFFVAIRLANINPGFLPWVLPKRPYLSDSVRGCGGRRSHIYLLLCNFPILLLVLACLPCSVPVSPSLNLSISPTSTPLLPLYPH